MEQNSDKRKNSDWLLLCSKSSLAPVLHDFRKTVTSEVVIISMVLLVALSLTIISLVNGQQPKVTNLASGFFAGTMGLFVPLVAIIGAYSSYGKDRISGVLESVLCRPVTRQSLSLSRYISTVLGLSAATIISIMVVYLALGYFDGSYLNVGFLAATFGGLFVEITAFVALIFLISHLVKTTGELFGVSIGLYLAFGFFWSLLILALNNAIHAIPGSALSIQVEIICDFFNPTQYVTLVYSFLTQSLSSVPIETSLYGLTLTSLVSAGLLWITIPLFVFLRSASKRD
ncbi:MAG: ABC transporter permease [Nitrososphaerales archaeon]